MTEQAPEAIQAIVADYPADLNRSTFDEVMFPNYAPAPMIPVKGEGSTVYDADGNQYIDLTGGIAVNVLGHCHPKMVEAIQRQSERLWHVSNGFTNHEALKFARRLANKTFADKVFFCNSGAEANEAAFKCARRYAVDHFGPEKDEIIAFHKSFHGRTFFTVSVGGQPSYYEGFGPVPGGITHLPYNDITALKAQISDKTCAVVLEPIQGEGGVIDADLEFVKAIRELTTKHNALMVVDEVQTGFGRTGKLYAYEHWGVEPDILSTAKSLGGGFPIGAILAKKDIAACMKPGTHGSTYGGNPMGCAVGNAILDVIEQENLLEHVIAMRAKMDRALQEINEAYPLFDQITGQGFLIGCQLKKEFHGRAKDFVALARKEGLMVLVAGGNVVRMAPALNLTESECEAGMARFEASARAFLQIDSGEKKTFWQKLFG